MTKFTLVSCQMINAIVRDISQGSTVGPLLFTIYGNCEYYNVAHV